MANGEIVLGRGWTMGKDYSKYQQKVIKAYYDSRDTIRFRSWAR